MNMISVNKIRYIPFADHNHLLIAGGRLEETFNRSRRALHFIARRLKVTKSRRSGFCSSLIATFYHLTMATLLIQTVD